jgi:hypothetical protein
MDRAQGISADGPYFIGIRAHLGMVPYILIWFYHPRLMTAGSRILTGTYPKLCLESRGNSHCQYYSVIFLLFLFSSRRLRVEANMRRYAMQKIIHNASRLFSTKILWGASGNH